MLALLWLIDTVIGLYVWVLIASAVLSWLVSFGIVNTRNHAVYMIGDVLYRLTEPALRPIRRVLPNFGGLDLSPLVLILGVMFIQRLIHEFVPQLMMGGGY
ncbi:MAG: YggT family protein [Azospirillaceae bacterium]|nr:YggT family protein [Azospirillaceae bacterium]